MKRLITPVLGMTVVSAVLALNLRAESLPPGQVDFGEFAPPTKGGQFVEVNISSTLLSLASHFVEKDEPEVARVLKGLQLVHVNVIGVDEENRAQLEKRTQKIRSELSGKGWERIVAAREEGQDVSIYLKTQNKDTVQGLVVLVMAGDKQAVFVNIVGDIKPEQLAMVGDRLHIDPLKKLGHLPEK